MTFRGHESCERTRNLKIAMAACAGHRRKTSNQDKIAAAGAVDRELGGNIQGNLFVFEFCLFFRNFEFLKF